MRRILLAAALLASPILSATAARAQDMLSGSLIEALKAIEKPELGGVFTYVGAKNAPRAFADLVARDLKALKRYTGKLMKDLKAAGKGVEIVYEAAAPTLKTSICLDSRKARRLTATNSPGVSSSVI